MTEYPEYQSPVPPLPEAWPESVSGEAILDQIESICSTYVFLPKGASTAIALWVVHTYAYEAAEHFPVLSVVSPEKRCGKTTLLRVLKGLVRQAVMASHFSVSVIYRLIDAFRPTLLIDETDTYFEGARELIGILNAGHLRGGQVALSEKVGNTWAPIVLAVWGPKAIAKIGFLPPTLLDRSITIHLHRRPAHAAAQARWESPLEDDLADLRKKIVRWTADHLSELTSADPSLPKQLNDRAADNWRPLIAIADVVGSRWGQKARDAALVLSEEDADDLTMAEMALEDFRTIIEKMPEKRISSQDLVAAMLALSERPWPNYQGRSRGMSAIDLAALLKNYGIASTKIRFGGHPLQGYKVDSQVQDMFDRYTKPDSELPEHPEPNGGES